VRRKLVTVTAVMALLLAIGGAVALAARSGSPASGSASAVRLPPATAVVTRTTLNQTQTVSGTLGYGDPVAVYPAGQGTLTWVAPSGSTVAQGEPLFKLDEQPVVELYGTVPMYRALGAGAVGTDVRQLEETLAALGYSGFVVDTDFDAGTADAVSAWQTDLGLSATGTVERGQVVFTPGPVRVAQQIDQVGATIVGERGEAVLAYSGTDRLATVQLPFPTRRWPPPMRRSRSPFLAASAWRGPSRQSVRSRPLFHYKQAIRNRAGRGAGVALRRQTPPSR
jgi:multidrug efflux system membrane fusion protein